MDLLEGCEAQLKDICDLKAFRLNFQTYETQAGKTNTYLVNHLKKMPKELQEWELYGKLKFRHLAAISSGLIATSVSVPPFKLTFDI